MKNKTTFGIIAIMMMVGLFCKELTEMFIPFIEGGNTQYYSTFTSLLNLANVHHTYLPNIHIDKYVSAWGLFSRILVMAVMYITINMGYYNKKIGYIITGAGIAYNIGIMVFTQDMAVLGDTVVIAFVGIMYILGLFRNYYMNLMLGLYIGGSIGNFVEGNVRGYVVDYLWLLPNWSDQVHNLEDMMIWVGLFGMVLGIGYFIFKGLISICKRAR